MTVMLQNVVFINMKINQSDVVEVDVIKLFFIDFPYYKLSSSDFEKLVNSYWISLAITSLRKTIKEQEDDYSRFYKRSK